MTAGEASLLTAASAVAGVINAIAGGGTLITFPALMACGLSPVTANMTNSVALFPGALSTVYALRKELGGAGPWLRVLLPVAVIGALCGAALLMVTPAKTFAAIVPFLILLATGLLAFQAPLQRVLRRIRPAGEVQPGWRPGFVAFQFLLGVYGGYFGAGLGIMMISGLSLLGLTNIVQTIVLRNICAVAVNGIAAAYFIAVAPVSWPHVGAMFIGQLIGGYAGGRLSRALPATLVRSIIVTVGLALGGWMLFTWH